MATKKPKKKATKLTPALKRKRLSLIKLAALRQEYEKAARVFRVCKSAIKYATTAGKFDVLDYLRQDQMEALKHLVEVEDSLDEAERAA
jgi:hypothetical protein